MSHVLIIEDDEDVVAVVAHHLRKHGHSVSVAYDGSEGYLTAVRERPDLVLLDLLLPGFTGQQVLHLLRTNPDVRGTPILVLSALEGAERRTAAADDTLGKPFRLDVLSERIRRLLGPGGNLATGPTAASA
ncbi:MAG: response regulator transcription factor [Planctomycetota bacterium JB042]